MPISYCKNYENSIVYAVGMQRSATHTFDHQEDFSEEGTLAVTWDK